MAVNDPRRTCSTSTTAPIPAIAVDPLKAEFTLSDAQIRLCSAAFTIVYAVFGVPPGRLADRASRRLILIGGRAVWSLLTAATGVAGGFVALVIVRLVLGLRVPEELSLVGYNDIPIVSHPCEKNESAAFPVRFDPHVPAREDSRAVLV